MDAKNKIYATVQGSRLLGCSIYPYRYCDEYIRKDSLLEWAEGKKKHYLDRQEYDCGWNDLLEELIDKINSL